MPEGLTEGLTQWVQCHTMCRNVKQQKRECLRELRAKVTELGVSIKDLKVPLKAFLTVKLDTEGIVQKTDPILEVPKLDRTEDQRKLIKERNQLHQNVSRWYNSLEEELNQPEEEDHSDIDEDDGDSDVWESEDEFVHLGVHHEVQEVTEKRKTRGSARFENFSQVSDLSHEGRPKRGTRVPPPTDSVASDTRESTRKSVKDKDDSNGTSGQGSESSEGKRKAPLKTLPCGHFRSLYREKGLYRRQLKKAESLSRQIADIAFSQSSEVGEDTREWALETDCKYVYGGRIRLFIANATLCNWGTMAKPWDLIAEEEEEERLKKLPRTDN